MSPRSSSPDRETVIVSFRAPVELVKRLDELAEGDQRNRANFILKLLTAVASAHEPLVQDGVFWLQAFHGSYAKSPVSSETEFWRGKIAGWKRSLVTSYGADIAERIILRAREVAKLPVPHSGTLAPDGSGYEGFDSFSDVGF
jgi:hypothetical protein